MQVASAQPRTSLKNRRIAVGTQRKVASELGITESHLRSIESGTTAPGTKLLFEICHYFKSDVSDLFPDLVNLSFFQLNSN